MAQQTHEVEVLLNGGPVMAVAVKNNKQTVWVRLPDGNTIRRHKRKHVLQWPQGEPPLHNAKSGGGKTASSCEDPDCTCGCHDAAVRGGGGSRVVGARDDDETMIPSPHDPRSSEGEKNK